MLDDLGETHSHLSTEEELATAILRSLCFNTLAPPSGMRQHIQNVEAQMEAARGIRNIIDLDSVTGHFKVYHPRSNQSVPPRGGVFLCLVGCSWQGLVVCFSSGMQQWHAPAVSPRGGVRGTVVPRSIRVAKRRFSPSWAGLPGAGFARLLPP
jgi:hypothetical protein